MKRGTLLFVGLLTAFPSLARAETINLSCSGTYWAPGNPPVNMNITSQGVQVDLEGKHVFGLYDRVFSITRVAQAEIGFWVDWFFGPGVAGSVGGTLDRITGKLELNGIKSRNAMTIAFQYVLQCQPVKPLF